MATLRNQMKAKMFKANELSAKIIRDGKQSGKTLIEIFASEEYRNAEKMVSDFKAKSESIEMEILNEEISLGSISLGLSSRSVAMWG